MPTAKSKTPVNVSAFIRAQPIDMPAAEVLKKLNTQHGIVKKPELVWSVRKEMRKVKGGARKSTSAVSTPTTQDLAKVVRNVVFRYGYEAVTRELEKLRRELA